MPPNVFGAGADGLRKTIMRVRGDRGPTLIERVFVAWIANNAKLDAQGIDSSRVSADKTSLQFFGVTT